LLEISLKETDAPPRRQPPQSGGLPRRKITFSFKELKKWRVQKQKM